MALSSLSSQTCAGPYAPTVSPALKRFHPIYPYLFVHSTGTLSIYNDDFDFPREILTVRSPQIENTRASFYKSFRCGNFAHGCVPEDCTGGHMLSPSHPPRFAREGRAPSPYSCASLPQFA